MLQRVGGCQARRASSRIDTCPVKPLREQDRQFNCDLSVRRGDTGELLAYNNRVDEYLTQATAVR